MNGSPQDQLRQIASHLDAAKGLLARLDSTTLAAASTLAPAPSAPATTPALGLGLGAPSGDLAAMFRAAEKRANEAEVALSRLSREMDGVREQAQASVRDIQRLAFQDPLTGLANLHLLAQHLDSLAGHRLPEQEIVCLLMDLDRFGVINQTMGHEVGDALLVQVGERLNQLARPNLAVGRRGEDEFSLVLSGVPQAEVRARSAALAEAVARALQEPFFIQGQKVQVGASMGASSMPSLAPNGKDLLRQADSAVSHVKRQGRGRFSLYDARLHRELQRDMMLEFQMRHALEADEFFLEYLPLVWLEPAGKTGWSARVVGVEALVRWHHRIEGVLPPNAFLPLAEKSGLIVPLGEWVIRQACRQLSEWSAAGLELFINVNLYGRQLLQPGLVEVIRAAVAETGVAPARLSFELTENVAMLDEPRIDDALAQLQAGGFPLAIDNFGEGFSSLSRMSRANFLKLSRELVQGDVELCRKAVAVAGGMGMVAVGVGVETQEQARFLAQSGCLMLQGYLFSPPCQAAAVPELAQPNQVWKI
jgi:diguanylate cyclase (GGDEF)-like protein